MEGSCALVLPVSLLGNIRRPLAAQPVLGHEIDPVLGFEKRASFAADCCAPAMVCWLTLSMA